jgi:16S rRNA (uracil1498-N3)-methyltransferase
MIRVFVPPGSIATGATIALDEEEGHHLEVRRAGERTAGHALDGAGGLGMGTLRHQGGHWLFTVEMAVIEPRPPELVLAVGAGDRDRFLTLAEKAAELGVTRLIPLDTQHSRSVASKLREGAIDKARRRAREGCKQSGNAWIPAIDALATIAALPGMLPGVPWLLADPHGDDLPSRLSQEPVGWLIGPEAGFVEAELEEIGATLGATPIRLGRHVLRFETAAIAAAVLTERARAEHVRDRRT